MISRDETSIESHHQSYVGDYLLELAPVSDADLAHIGREAPFWIAKTIDLIDKTGAVIDATDPLLATSATPWVPFLDGSKSLRSIHTGDLRYEATLPRERPDEEKELVGAAVLALVGRSAAPKSKPTTLAVLSLAGAFLPKRGQSGTWRLSGYTTARDLFDYKREFHFKRILLPDTKAGGRRS